jgi:hypothetical protein
MTPKSAFFMAGTIACQRSSAGNLSALPSHATSRLGHERHRNTFEQCPLWVRSGHRGWLKECPLYPQKQTLIERVGMSALCQKRTLAVQENSDLSRRQTTMKLATDLPNGDLQHLREMTLRSA